MTALATQDGIRRWQILSLQKGLELYAKTGMKATRQYTPANMMKAVKAWLPNSAFKPRDYLGAAAALGELLK